MTGLFEAFDGHTSQSPEKTAFVFLVDGGATEINTTYLDLRRKSISFGGNLIAKTLHQKPVLLLYPPGIDYIEAFLSCQAAGAIAVPIYPPRSSKHADRLSHIIQDSGASTILTTAKYREKLKRFPQDQLEKCEILTLEDDFEAPEYDYRDYQGLEKIAFIQYTSGSTGQPKGVVITNKNVLANEEQIRSAIRQDQDSVIVSWLPMYHDMGLIGNILHNLYIGSKCVFFPPVNFLQHPLKWLRAISKYKATLSGAPNFAFDLLNKIDLGEEKIDLSSLQIAFNGSEKVRHDTLSEFIAKFQPYGLDPKAVYPCYGLAEATLMVSGYQRGEGFRTLHASASDMEKGRLIEDESGEVALVSAGHVRPGITVLILGEGGEMCTEAQIGHICIAGDNVTGSYWGGRSAESFFERDGKRFVRTGDLGSLLGGHLYITGRAKEIIIRHGVNYYPYDIERLVSSAHRGLDLNGSAVFSHDNGKTERLIVVTEIKRTYYREMDADEVFAAIGKELSEAYGFTADDILLLKPMALPRTSSGKIRRSHCAKVYAEGGLEALASLEAEKEALTELKALDVSQFSAQDSPEILLAYLEYRVSEILGKSISLSLDSAVHSIGLDSLHFMQFTACVESELQVKLDLNLLYEDIDFAELIRHIKDSAQVASQREAQKSVSYNAEGLWLASQNGLVENNIGFSFSLSGLSDARQRLKDSLTAALESFGFQNRRFHFDSGTLITTEAEGPLFQEWHCSSQDDIENRLAAIYTRVPDLAEDQLLHLVLFEDPASDALHVSFITHHIVSDGWSLALLFDRWMKALEGQPLPRTQEPNNLIADEEKAISKPELLAKASQLFEDVAAANAVNLLPHTIDSSKLSGGSFTWQLPQKDLLAVAEQLVVSPYVLLLGTYHIALSHLTLNDHLCTVTPFSRRNSHDRQAQFDYLVNLMYLGSSIVPEESPKTYFAGLNRHFREALKYQEIPYSHLLRESELDVEEKNALGLYYFAYHAFAGQEDFQKLFGTAGKSVMELGNGGHIRSAKGHTQKGNFKLEFEVFEGTEALFASLKHSHSHFSDAFIQTLSTAMDQLLAEFAKDLDRPIGTIPFLSSTLQSELMEEATGKIKDLEKEHFLDQFLAVVEQYPDRIALQQGQRSFTYRDLHAASDHIAWNLAYQFGLNKGERVLLPSDKHILELVALLGIMKAGGVYVPVEADIPSARLAQIVEDCQIRYVVTQSSVDYPVKRVLTMKELMNGEMSGRIKRRVEDAYIIHTSGTTGRPKGVLVKQKGLVNLNASLVDSYQLQATDRVLQFASLSFDMSVEEIFPYWSVGAAVVMREKETIDSIPNFIRYITEQDITVLNLPTAFWAECTALSQLPEQLRLVAVGGEKVPLKAAREWLQKFGSQVRTFNAYGPTEYTVNATLKEMKLAEMHEVSVGMPVHNTQVFVMNQYGGLLPKGMTGEVVLTGAGLAAGYLQDMGEANPFQQVELPSALAPTIYRTGDLGYRNAQGEIVILGRKDKQAKVRGYRIELKEVEVFLENNSAVQRALAIVHQGTLVAFIQAAPGPEIDEPSLRGELASSLPPYMIPGRILVLDRFPVNVRGKIDHRALQDLLQYEDMEIVAPTTPLEESLLGLWSEVLDIENFGTTQSFFEIGGHSIKAIKLLSQIEQKMGKKISLQTFYQASTIQGLAGYIETLDWIEAPMESWEGEQEELVI